jgi:2-polyprenyl-3-methyl-5-hydroxy-6-metoxy-1,4-benzoquinol methylase
MKNKDFYDALFEVGLLDCKNEARLRFVAQNVSHHIKMGISSILDVGCSSGFITAYLKSMGYKVIGSDLSPKRMTSSAD